MKLAALLVLLSASFWETKAPADWTNDEVLRLFTDSPWGQMASPEAQQNTTGGAVDIYLATAAPMVAAEKERQRRYVRHPNAPVAEDPLVLEYRLWLKDNSASQIVVAIPIPRTAAFDDAEQTRRMEEESVMHVGHRKYKITGSFPPTPGDPYLRLAFPREVTAKDKTVDFDLYLPGVTPPYRSAEFRVKDMMVNGKLEM